MTLWLVAVAIFLAAFLFWTISVEIRIDSNKKEITYLTHLMNEAGLT